MEFVDTHCHLQFDKLADVTADIIRKAEAAGVTRLICVGTTLADSQKAIDIAAQYKNAWATAGCHPHDAGEFLKDVSSPGHLSRLLQQPKIVAIGEIGLDFYKNYSPKDVQIKALRQQIEAAQSSGLPFVFHIREAFDEFWPIFDSYSGLEGVVHSFSADIEAMQQALSRGLYIALNGIMTFTNDQKQLEAAKKVPLDRLLLETDAPFLTPASKRGRICEPAFTADTAHFLAELRGEAPAEMASVTTANAVKLFNLKAV